MRQGTGQVKSASDRTARRRRKLEKAGLRRTEVWVRPVDVPLIHFIADRIRNGAIVSISPPSRPDDSDGPGEGKASKGTDMEAVSSPWTVESLKQAIEQDENLVDGEFVCTISQGAEKVLEVVVAAAGDIRLYVAINGDQIITTTLLWPRDDQEDPAAFEAMMLRAHKVYMPLSALSVDAIDGREYYELFGSMSARSVLSSVIMEFRTIANNALELARDLGPQADAA